MEQVLTMVCKLNPNPKQVVQIEATLKAFADACNYGNQQVKTQITSKTTIQNLVYQDLRSFFGLSANLAVRACARVGARACFQTRCILKKMRSLRRKDESRRPQQRTVGEVKIATTTTKTANG